MSKPAPGTIAASIRPGRQGDKVGAWIAEQARGNGGFIPNDTQFAGAKTMLEELPAVTTPLVHLQQPSPVAE